MVNRSALPLQINGILQKDKLIFLPEEKIILPSRSFSARLQITLLTSYNDETIDSGNLKISYNLLGSDKKKLSELLEPAFFKKHFSSELIMAMNINSNSKY